MTSGTVASAKKLSGDFFPLFHAPAGIGRFGPRDPGDDFDAYHPYTFPGVTHPGGLAGGTSDYLAPVAGTRAAMDGDPATRRRAAGPRSGRGAPGRRWKRTLDLGVGRWVNDANQIIRPGDRDDHIHVALGETAR